MDTRDGGPLSPDTGERYAHRNVSRERCLVCCPDGLFAPEHAAILISLGYEVKAVNTSGAAFRQFMAVKPSLLIVHHTFLPWFPHRLIQMFKMAHRTPAVLLLAEDVSQVLVYLHLKNEGYFEFLETPLSPEDLALGVKLASERLKNTRRKLFFTDLLTQTALALPVFALLAYLAMKYR
jgi:FixJ family two-component response regulator